MTGYQVEAQGLSVSFGATRALAGVSFLWPAGAIVGVLGRNGAGKSTLMEVLAAFRRPGGGQVLLDGEPVYGNPRLAAGICLIREAGDFQGATRVSDVLARAATVRESFDSEGAVRLLGEFGLDATSKLRGLSRGQRGALAGAIAIASRAPLTLLDECYLGLDAPSRRRFYDALVADYVTCPRTIVLSSHLLGEVEPLLERVLILDRGRVAAQGPADELRETCQTLTGPAAAIGRFVAGREVLATRRLGPLTQVTLRTSLSPREEAEAARAGMTAGHLAIEDLYIALSEPPDGGPASERPGAGTAHGGAGVVPAPVSAPGPGASPAVKLAAPAARPGALNELSQEENR